MEKLTLILFMTLFFSSSLISQYYVTENEVIPLKENHSFYLNSKTRVGGKTRNTIKIDLPKNTVQWFYTFTTTLNESNKTSIEESINLSGQLMQLISSSAINTSGVTLPAKAIYQIIKPTGVGVIDAYLVDQSGYRDFYKKDALGMWLYPKPGFYAEGTVENQKDASVVIDDLTEGSVYLCFKNPSPMEGVWVTVEIAAVVAKQKYVDEWTSENLATISKNCTSQFSFDKLASQSICACLIEKMSTDYTPSIYFDLTKSQQTRNVYNKMVQCSKETGTTHLLDKKERVEKLYEEIRGYHALKDYNKLIELTEELLSLGVNSHTVYSSLGWYCILSSRF